MIKPIQSFEEYTAAYASSISDPEAYWASQAEQFVWKKKWNKILEWNFTEPTIKWFVGGKLNITENILDRHVTSNPDKVALYWEANNPEESGSAISYK